VKFDCGCGNGVVVIWKKVIENCGLLLMSCWLVAGAGRKLSLWFAPLKPQGKDAQRAPELARAT
jgi:hypothetical protein